LDSGLPKFPQDFSCPMVLKFTQHPDLGRGAGYSSIRPKDFNLRDFYPLWWPFPGSFS